MTNKLMTGFIVAIIGMSLLNFITPMVSPTQIVEKQFTYAYEWVGTDTFGSNTSFDLEDYNDINSLFPSNNFAASTNPYIDYLELNIGSDKFIWVNDGAFTQTVGRVSKVYESSSPTSKRYAIYFYDISRGATYISFENQTSFKGILINDYNNLLGGVYYNGIKYQYTSLNGVTMSVIVKGTKLVEENVYSDTIVALSNLMPIIFAIIIIAVLVYYIKRKED